MSESSTTFLTAEQPTGARRYLPFLTWMPRYRRSRLTGDVIAGISVAARCGS